MKVTIAIPTFWRGHQNNSLKCASRESDYIFDNATPLDQEGTLSRAFESIKSLNSDDDVNIAVIAVPASRELNQAVQLKVESIVAQYERDFPVFLIGPDTLFRWRDRLHKDGNEFFDDFLSLGSYAMVYNLCLLAGVLTGADAVALFRDDGVYDDPDYLLKALEFIGSNHNGEVVAGVAGYCRFDDGGHLLSPARQRWQQLWGDWQAMNEMFEMARETPRLKKTLFAPCGNMVIHRSVFEKVPFDPRVPRGSDIDYLMNARLSGHEFFLDNQLWLRNTPRESCGPSWLRMRKDITRFNIVRAKLHHQPKDHGYRLRAEDFGPYPGRFLKDDLHDLVLRASVEMAAEYLIGGKEAEARQSISNIAISKAEANVNDDSYNVYRAYQHRWQDLIGTVPDLKIWLADRISD